jgi:hypothetical protein
MKILSKLPNTSGTVNGVRFFPHELGMLSEEIEEEVALIFLKIEGYVRLVPTKTEKQEAEAAAAAKAEAAAAAAAKATPVASPAVASPAVVTTPGADVAAKN